MPKEKRRRNSKRGPIAEILICIFIVAILYFGIQAVLVLALNTSTPLLAVESRSMRPNFDRGDLLIIRGVDSVEDIAEGDIIVFWNPELQKRIVHRVINIVVENNHTYFVTKGDANLDPDKYLVKFEDLRGEKIFVIPKLGYVSLWLRRK